MLHFGKSVLAAAFAAILSAHGTQICVTLPQDDTPTNPASPELLVSDDFAAAMPALGFGTLIPDPVATRNATKAALEAGFCVIDTAERYRTEKEVGQAMQDVFSGGKIKRENVFVITKLWNTNHRPERVKTGVPGFIPRR